MRDADSPAPGSPAEVIRAALQAAADPVRAVAQQAYMKSEMPFWGVALPELRRIVRPTLAGLDGPAALELAASLWAGAEHREERYAALAALAARPLRGQLEAVPLIQRFVLEGRWWDIVDELAHRIADLHDAHPADTREIVLAWSDDRRDEPVAGAGMWLRRLAILSQLGRRDRIDLDLLAEVIDRNAADREFFIRKAIGWALREVARTRPDWVVAFCDSRDLSPLSRREALKHVAA
jgi:3-methyladenine DNA glycosylase AlkD